MSNETWIAEYYPVPADECPKEHAAQHSLHKWRGLTQEALAEHGVIRYGDVAVIYIDSSTCALCEHYACHSCPIVKMRGRTCQPEYEKWLRTGDASPMIRLLEQVAAKEKKG